MTDFNIAQLNIIQKINLNDIDFDSLDISNLEEIKKELEEVINYKRILGKRLESIEQKIKIEKKNKKDQMIKEIDEEISKKKKQLLKIQEIENDDQSEDDDEEEIESVVYNKKSPKGKVTKKPARGKAVKK